MTHLFIIFKTRESSSSRLHTQGRPNQIRDRRGVGPGSFAWQKDPLRFIRRRTFGTPGGAAAASGAITINQASQALQAVVRCSTPKVYLSSRSHARNGGRRRTQTMNGPPCTRHGAHTPPMTRARGEYPRGSPLGMSRIGISCPEGTS